MGEKVFVMVLKFECPKCGKGEESEVQEVLPDRKYKMKCGDCGSTFIPSASVEEERKVDNK